MLDSLESAAAEAEAPDAEAAPAALEAAAGATSTFQAESCLTFDPPHPSCEKRASRTELSCSKCLEVDPLVVEAVLVVWV